MTGSMCPCRERCRASLAFLGSQWESAAVGVYASKLWAGLFGLTGRKEGRKEGRKAGRILFCLNKPQHVLGWPKSLYVFSCKIEHTFFISTSDFIDLDILSRLASSHVAER